MVIAGLFVGAPLLFSINMVVARGLGGALPPATLACGRWLVAALVLLPAVWPWLRRHPSPLALVRLMAVPVLLGGVFSVAPQYAAAARTSAGHIALIFAATPLLVAMIERLAWAVPIRRRTLAGTMLGMLGIATMTLEGEWSRLLTFEGNPGDALALVAALAWATYTARLRHCPVELPPLVFLWGLAAGAALVLAPLSAAEWTLAGTPPVLTARVAAGVLCLALVAGIGAYLAYGRLVARVGAAHASLAMYLVPVYALALGALLLGEALQTYQAIALALVVGGVAVGTAPLGRRARSTP